MPILGMPVLAFGLGEWALRASVLPLNLLALAALWGFARSVTGVRAAILATFTLATVPAFMARAAQYMNDGPSLGFVLLATWLVWTELEKESPTRRLLWVAPLAAAAFYLRYGNAVSLAGIALAMVVIWPRQVLRNWRLVTTTAAIFLALLLPFFLLSSAVSDSPVGILFGAGKIAGREYLGQGLGEYIRWFPNKLAGRLGAILMAAGLVAIVIRIRFARHGGHRLHACLAIIAGFHIIVLGLVSHAERRFAFLAVALLVLLGADALIRAYDRLRPLGRRSGVLVVIAVGLGTATYNGLKARNRLYLPNWGYEVLRGAGSLIRESNGNNGCTILGQWLPHLTWYSACATFPFDRWAEKQQWAEEQGAPLYLVRVKRHRPGSEQFPEHFVAEEWQPLRSFDNGRGLESADVYRLAPRDGP
jgi:4-amino-4-deoxy-L-arabinose transferase-like glycosyltransferase